MLGSKVDCRILDHRLWRTPDFEPIGRRSDAYGLATPEGEERRLRLAEASMARRSTYIVRRGGAHMSTVMWRVDTAKALRY